LGAQFGGVQAARVLAQVLAAGAIDDTLVRVFPLATRDGNAVDFGHRGTATVTEFGITVHAEENKRRDDQQQHEPQGQTGVVADEIKHQVKPLNAGQQTTSVTWGSGEARSR
jgi:hypothetical protein